jgi:SAM-dependent methyltransferase
MAAVTNASTTAGIRVSCNLCGADDFAVRFEAAPPQPHDLASDLKASTDRFASYGRIVRCRVCGLVYTNPRPSAETLTNGYEEVEDPDYLAEPSSRSINAHMALHTVRRFAQSGRLLDIGCSAGFMLQAARGDYTVTGLEPSRWACDLIRSKYGIEVVQGTIDTADFPAGAFDIITMNDVIEHLDDPGRALVKLRTWLRPGGLLYIVTPDIESLSAKLLQGRWWGLRPAHIYYFSRKTMRALLHRAGFEVVFEKSYGRVFTWEYWLSRLANYPAFIRDTVGAGVRAFGVEHKFLYLDTRDSMEMCAKVAGAPAAADRTG